MRVENKGKISFKICEREKRSWQVLEAGGVSLAQSIA
jgi:hypothetical protein